MREDIPILAAYEVYSHGQDLHEFVESLKLIDQLNFFKNNLVIK